MNLVHICTLCNLAINTPSRTSKCDHVFCSDCISMWLKDNNSCPFKCSAIRLEDFYFVSKKELSFTSAPFKCPRYSQGCKKILMRSDLQLHLGNECEFRSNKFDQQFISREQISDKKSKLKGFNSNCFLDLSPLSNIPKGFQSISYNKNNQNTQNQDGFQSPSNYQTVLTTNSYISNINNYNILNSEEQNNSSFSSNLGTQIIPDESDTTAEYFSSIQNIPIEQIQMTEMSKTIVFLSDQFRKFLQYFIFSLKAKSNQTHPFENILEKNDFYFSQLEQKVEQIKKTFLQKEKGDQGVVNRISTNYNGQEDKGDLIRNKNFLKGKTNQVQVLQDQTEQTKHIKNTNKQIKVQQQLNHRQQLQQQNNNAPSQNKNILINIDQDELQNNKLAKKVNISLVSNQENNPALINQINEKRNSNRNKQTDKSQNSQTSIKLNNLFLNEQSTANAQVNNTKIVQNLGLQSKKNSSYTDLKKVQKLTFEKSGQIPVCNLNTRNSLKSWRKSSSRENIRLNTQEQYSENTQFSSPRIELNKTAKTQQASRNSIINILQFPLQFYNEQNDQQDQLTKVNIISSQSIQEQFTSRFEQHGISEDCKNLDTEEFSSQKILTKNFSINRNQLDAKENENFQYSNENQMLNQILLGNETFQQHLKSSQDSQAFMENGDENINDITQVDMQNTNTTIHFLKACKSTLNNSIDLKQSYQTYLNPRGEKQIIQQLEQDPKNRGEKENDIRYIVNAKWWRNWTQYVNYYEKDYNQYNYDHSNLLDKRFSVNYERPSYINNKVLTKDSYLFDNYQNVNSNLLQLNENLLEHHDYVVMSKPVFMQLKKWYNVDVIIPRFIKFDSFERMFYVELYPEYFFKQPMQIKKKNNVFNLILISLKLPNLFFNFITQKKTISPETVVEVILIMKGKIEKTQNKAIPSFPILEITPQAKEMEHLIINVKWIQPALKMNMRVFRVIPQDMLHWEA